MNLKKSGFSPCFPALLLLLVFGLLYRGSTCQAAESRGSLMARARNYYYGIGVQKDYEQALQLYMRAARLGDAEAKYIAGGMYFKGYGTDKNFRMAFQLLHQAAQEGQTSPEGQQALAQSYLMGLGTMKNYKKALQWYTLAAENGNTEAQNELGYMYFIGNGVAQDM
jgi:TPR repeat protein